MNVTYHKAQYTSSILTGKGEKKRLSCFAHTISFAGEEALKLPSVTTAKIREIVHWIKTVFQFQSYKFKKIQVHNKVRFKTFCIQGESHPTLC